MIALDRKVVMIGLTLQALVVLEAREATARERARGVESAPVQVARRLPRGAACLGFASPLDALPERWGEATATPEEPPTSACVGDGRSLELLPAEVGTTDVASLRVASVEERQARRGRVRTLDVSFLVPEESFASWNHVAAFVAFDDSDDRYRRVGAAAFASILYVELVDPECALASHLLAGVAVPGGIVPGRWYRLYADLDVRGEQRSIEAALADLDTLEVVAETELLTACPLRWTIETKTSAAFLAEVPFNDASASPRMLLDDYFANAVGVTARLAAPRRAVR